MKLKQNENFSAKNSAISKAMKILKLINHQNGISVKSLCLLSVDRRKCFFKIFLIGMLKKEWKATSIRRVQCLLFNLTYITSKRIIKIKFNKCSRDTLKIIFIKYN